jgi:acetate kinase
MSQTDGYLVINAGSSSLKFSVFTDETGGGLKLVVTGQISGIGGEAAFSAKDATRKKIGERTWEKSVGLNHAGAVDFVLNWLKGILPDLTLTAAGHRVVHGGRRFYEPVRIDPGVLEELVGLIPLAPLHEPHNISAIRALIASHPDLPQVACFDTAFHRTMPKVAETYAIPHALTEEGICRYGFHGLSYEFIARRLKEVAPDVAEGHVVVAHLGNGASLSAMKGGKCQDTTMGFSTVEGVPMGTRTGSIDPGILIHLIRSKGMGLDELEKLIYHQSGLLGVSGLSNDMRALAESDDPRAALAIDLFCFRVAKEIGALAASMGGFDALVFTAGIGENSPLVRRKVLERLAWLGIDADWDANGTGALAISRPGSRIQAFVIPTDEEQMIALHTRRVLTGR